MILFVAVVVLFGFAKRLRTHYWVSSAVACGLQVMAALLFAGGGSIQNPQGDGWITWAIRPAFEQWPLLALFPGVLNIVVGWAIPLWLVRNSWLITKREREVLAREHEAGGPLPVQPPPFWWHY